MFSTSEDPKIRPLCAVPPQPVVGSRVLMKVIPSTFVQCLQDHLQPFNASSSPPPPPSPASLASTSWTPISLALDCISVLASATRPCTADSVLLSTRWLVRWWHLGQEPARGLGDEEPEREERGEGEVAGQVHGPVVVLKNDPSVLQLVFTITEKAPTRAFLWFKAPTSAFMFHI